MADKQKILIGRFQKVSIRPPTTSHDPSTSSEKPSFHETKPSNVDIILTELHNRRRGRPQRDLEWWCVRLSLDEFKSLEAHIEADETLNGFFLDKVKYVFSFPFFLS